MSSPAPGRLLLTGKAAAHVAGAGHPGSEKPVTFSDQPGEGMYFASILEVQAQDGKVDTEPDHIEITGATAFTIVVTASTGYRGFQFAPDTRLEEVIAKAQVQLDSAARKEVRGIAGASGERSSASLPPRVFTLGPAEACLKEADERASQSGWNSARPIATSPFTSSMAAILLISSSRPGSQPANLQGIWNYKVTPPWSC